MRLASHISHFEFMAWSVFFFFFCFKSVALLRAASTAATDLKPPQTEAGFLGEPLNTLSQAAAVDDISAAYLSSNRDAKLTAPSIRSTWSNGPRRDLFEKTSHGQTGASCQVAPNQTVFFCGEQNTCTRTIPRLP